MVCPLKEKLFVCYGIEKFIVLLNNNNKARIGLVFFTDISMFQGVTCFIFLCFEFNSYLV